MTQSAAITEAEVAEKIAYFLETDPEGFGLVDWNDLGEVTVHIGKQCFRMIVHDITNEGA